MEKSIPKTSEHKIHTPRNYPDESIDHSEQGESLKSKIIYFERLGHQTHYCRS